MTRVSTAGLDGVDCSDPLDHCHGTLVRHADGTVECTDAACVVLAADRHGLVLACVEAGCSCAAADADAG